MKTKFYMNGKKISRKAAEELIGKEYQYGHGLYNRRKIKEG